MSTQPYSLGLSEDEAANLRSDDVVLVAMAVKWTNNHFDHNGGMKVSCISTALDHRPREEREKGPVVLDVMSRFIHSVVRRPIKTGDWVQWSVPHLGRGKVIHITDDNEVMVRLRLPVGGRNHAVYKMDQVDRVLAPDDLTDAEKKAAK